MSRYQKLSLLIGALILVAVIALVAVVAFKPAQQFATSTQTEQGAENITATFVSAYRAQIAVTLTALASKP